MATWPQALPTFIPYQEPLVRQRFSIRGTEFSVIPLRITWQKYQDPIPALAQTAGVAFDFTSNPQGGGPLLPGGIVSVMWDTINFGGAAANQLYNYLIFDTGVEYPIQPQTRAQFTVMASSLKFNCIGFLRAPVNPGNRFANYDMRCYVTDAPLDALYYTGFPLWT